MSTDLPAGSLLLDYVRYEKHLTGTKIGCREGDCGACTVLIGDLQNDQLTYRSFTSCLTPLGNVHGKHVVTVEGVNLADLNPIQKAMVECSGTQCGFCTPGFVVSMAGFCLSGTEANEKNAIAAIDGNICRCTGYKSIERAAGQVAEIMKEKGDKDAIEYVVKNNILPAYFSDIKDRLKNLKLQLNGQLKNENKLASFVGGGTDLYVQKHDEMKYADIHFMFDNNALNGVQQVENRCIIGPSATVTDLQQSPVFQKYFPHFAKQVKLVSSTPIRNMATIAGNFVNASPIGDFTIFFLALDATIVLTNGEVTRELSLRKLYKGYKNLDKRSEEYILSIYFQLPADNTYINFEKVSKRTHLDIASVNSAIVLTSDSNGISKAAISAGGVGPVPAYLPKTSEFLVGKYITEDTILEAVEIAQSEISPISDARGTAEYKRLLLGQLIKAHFITLFPEIEVEKMLMV